MENNKKVIQLLRSRIEKLKAEDFDLKAWKAGTVVMLERIFGPDSQKTREIEKIKYEQSSWALRDAKGSERLIDSCKRRGAEILQVAVEELQYLSLPDDQTDDKRGILHNVVLGALENELKIAQMKDLKQLLNSDVEEKKMRAKVIELLNGFGHEVVPNILAFVLCDPDTRKGIL